MIRKSILVSMVVLALLSLAGIANAAPSALKAVYVTDNRVDLEWNAQAGETYKVWKSTDGKQWELVTTTSAGASAYSVTNGIEPYKNYYFNVTTSDVTDYLTGSSASNPNISVVNSAYEVNAFPPNQHAHGYYASNTALCKNCHNTHTSTGPKLLSFATVNDTCMSCHDGTGSKYDVITGKVSTSDNAATTINAPAGPFGGKIFGNPIQGEPESIHTLGSVINTAPGGNPSGTGEWAEALGCGSCHDAHGSTNYRMLKGILPYAQNINVKAYAETGSQEENVFYVSGMNDFCMGCHPAYNAPKGSADTKYSVDFGGTVSGEAYRHSVGDGVYPNGYMRGGVPQPLSTSLPLEGREADYNDNKIICATCHTAHGSKQPSVFTKPEDTDGDSTTTNYLLRMENMGVCQDCHKL